MRRWLAGHYLAILLILAALPVLYAFFRDWMNPSFQQEISYAPLTSLTPDRTRTTVTVYEGRVEVASGADSVLLFPGEQAVRMPGRPRIIRRVLTESEKIGLMTKIVKMRTIRYDQQEGVSTGEQKFDTGTLKRRRGERIGEQTELRRARAVRTSGPLQELQKEIRTYENLFNEGNYEAIVKRIPEEMKANQHNARWIFRKFIYLYKFIRVELYPVPTRTASSQSAQFLVRARIYPVSFFDSLSNVLFFELEGTVSFAKRGGRWIPVSARAEKEQVELCRELMDTLKNLSRLKPGE